MDLWNKRCNVGGLILGKYNEQTGFFEVGTLKDITYEEAVVIYAHTAGLTGVDYNHMLQRYRGRAVMPFVTAQGQFANTILARFAMNCPNLEEVCLLSSPSLWYGFHPASLDYTFNGCPKLRSIYGPTMEIKKLQGSDIRGMRVA